MGAQLLVGMWPVMPMGIFCKHRNHIAISHLHSWSRHYSVCLSGESDLPASHFSFFNALSIAQKLLTSAPSVAHDNVQQECVPQSYPADKMDSCRQACEISL